MRFLFYVHKPKARSLARAFMCGAAFRGHSVRVESPGAPRRDGEILITYGVTPAMLPEWRRAFRDGMALYLDNGFLNSRDRATIRFSWNSVQPFRECLHERNRPLPFIPEDVELPRRFNPILWELSRSNTAIRHNPAGKPIRTGGRGGRILLCLPTRRYLESVLALPPSDETASRIASKLARCGWAVTVRHKPRDVPRLQRSTIPPVEWEIDRHDAVASLNSAVSVKALMAGKPAYCLLPCTLSEWCPPAVPPHGSADVPGGDEIARMIRLLASHEFTLGEIETGVAFDMILSIPERDRRGHVYAGIGGTVGYGNEEAIHGGDEAAEDRDGGHPG